MNYDDWKTGERLPCGCYGSCDPYAHDTAPDWDGKVDGPGRHYEPPYRIDEVYSGWEVYDEDDYAQERPLAAFSTLEDAIAWCEIRNYNEAS
jgi:hypothetical protein